MEEDLNRSTWLASLLTDGKLSLYVLYRINKLIKYWFRSIYFQYPYFVLLVRMKMKMMS